MRTTLLFSLLLAAACGKSPKPITLAKAETPLSAQMLVPADATAVIRAASCSAIDEATDLAAEMAGQRPPDMLRLLTRGQVDFKQLDRDQPVLAAFSVTDPRKSPRTTVVLALPDAEGAAATDGTFSSFVFDGEAAGGDSLLGGELVDGDFSVRVDLEAALKVLGNDLRAGLAMGEAEFTAEMKRANPQVDMSDMARGIFKFLRDAMDSAAFCDGSLDIDGGKVTAHVAVSVKEGSALADPGESKLAELAPRLPSDFPIRMLVRLNMGKLTQFALPMTKSIVAAMPQNERAATERYIRELSELSEGLGDEWAFAFRMAPTGMQMAMAGRAANAEAYVEGYMKLVSGPMPSVGVVLTEEGSREIDGVKVRRMRMRIDREGMRAMMGGNMPRGAFEMMETIYGKDGMALEIAGNDDMLFFASAGSNTMETLLAANNAPPAAITSHEDDLGFFLEVDLRNFMADVRAVMGRQARRMPQFERGEPLLFTMVGSRSERTYRASAWTDVRKIKAWVEQSERRR